MSKKENLQHVQLPNREDGDTVEPKDQVIYLAIRSFMNSKTKEAFPSLQTIAEKVGASINTVRRSIKRLEESEYIEIRKEGRKVIYIFNELKKFEPFSNEFIENKNISLTTKAYLAASQQFMFKDEEGVGKIGFSNCELGKQINMPEATIRKCNKELKDQNLISYEGKDIKVVDLQNLGQAVIWKLGDHEERINENTNDIRKLRKELEAYKKLTEQLLKAKMSEVSIDL